MRRAPKLLILCGFPGSGKSTFCRKLIGRGQTQGPRWVRVSQDDLGSRSACEHEMMVARKRGDHVVLDRCNPTASERLQWAKLSMLPLSSVRGVHFATPAHGCLERVASRTLYSSAKRENTILSLSRKSFQHKNIVYERIYE